MNEWLSRYGLLVFCVLVSGVAINVFIWWFVNHGQDHLRRWKYLWATRHLPEVWVCNYNHTTVVTTRVWYKAGKMITLQYKEGGKEVRRFLPLNFFVFSEDGLYGAVGDFKLRNILLKECRVREDRKMLVVPPQRHNPWEQEAWRLFVPPQTDFRTAYRIVHGREFVAL